MVSSLYKTAKERFCPQINTICGAEALAVALRRIYDASALGTTFCKRFFLPFSPGSEEGERVSGTLNIWKRDEPFDPSANKALLKPSWI